jgi:hypothetical protein
MGVFVVSNLIKSAAALWKATTCVFICIFLVTNELEHVFMSLTTRTVFCENLAQVFIRLAFSFCFLEDITVQDKTAFFNMF